MPTKIIRDPAHISALGIILSNCKLPLTVSWVIGAPRSDVQNRLSQRWYSDIARQLGDRDREDVRATCKLHYGVPILREDDVAFRESYDRVLKPLPYEAKLATIKAFDLPVTRLMNVKQMTSYMGAVSMEYSAQGVRLTDPEALKYEEEFL